MKHRSTFIYRTCCGIFKLLLLLSVSTAMAAPLTAEQEEQILSEIRLELDTKIQKILADTVLDVSSEPMGPLTFSEVVEYEIQLEL